MYVVCDSAFLFVAQVQACASLSERCSIVGSASARLGPFSDSLMFVVVCSTSPLLKASAVIPSLHFSMYTVAFKS